jgi:hypothetical protein
MFDIAEFVKCREDFVYFAKAYLKIKHPVKGVIPFDLHDYQKKIVKAYNSHRFVILKKFRQGGISTLAVMWLLWKCMFFNDQSVLFIIKTDREAAHVAKIVDKAIADLPDWLKPEFTINNCHEKEFDTGSRLEFSTFEPRCGKALTHLVIDEAAFIPNMEENWKAAFPMISTGGNAIVMSTINGNNWFSKKYNAADTNGFHAVQIHFWEHPRWSNPEWAKEMKANLGIGGWHQEVLGEEYVVMPQELTNQAKKLTNWELAQRVRSAASKFTEDKEFRSYLLEAYERLEKDHI